MAFEVHSIDKISVIFSSSSSPNFVLFHIGHGLIVSVQNRKLRIDARDQPNGALGIVSTYQSVYFKPVATKMSHSEQNYVRKTLC